MPTIRTISELSADDIVKLQFRKGLKVANSIDLEDDTKYAVIVLKLHPSVTPSDYPALRSGIVGVTGILDADLLVDHKTKASVPVDHTQVLQAIVDISLRDDAPVDP